MDNFILSNNNKQLAKAWRLGWQIGRWWLGCRLRELRAGRCLFSQQKLKNKNKLSIYVICRNKLYQIITYVFDLKSFGHFLDFNQHDFFFIILEPLICLESRLLIS